MSIKSGITWEYTTWTPTSVGLKDYIIWANDTEGNINSYSSDITVVDTTDPVLDNYYESADPLELGQTETIEVDITDENTMEFVYLEFDGSNHSMSLKSGITWEYTTWTPHSVGLKSYTIWVNDTSGNIVSYSSDITVEDITIPTWDNLIESADPLLLGNNETITINAYDNSGIELIYLEYEGDNHTMNFISGDTWSYSNWKPASNSDYPYTVWIKDNNGLWNDASGSIEVSSIVDSLAPYWDNLIENADPIDLGHIIIIYIDVSDISGIAFVYLEYDGNNHTMTLVSGDMYVFMDWKPLRSGIKIYVIWMSDIYNNINSTSGSISVLRESINPSPDPLPLDTALLVLRLILIIGCVSFWILFSLGLFVYISRKKNDYTKRETSHKNRFKTLKNKVKKTIKKKKADFNNDKRIKAIKRSQKKFNQTMSRKRRKWKKAFNKRRRG